MVLGQTECCIIKGNHNSLQQCMNGFSIKLVSSTGNFSHYGPFTEGIKLGNFGAKA